MCSARMHGDGWMIKHDYLKLRLQKMCLWAGIPMECEVFNLFSSCIPQGLVPDFKLPGDQGAREILCKLNCINACVTWYPRNPGSADCTRAVERRADGRTEVYAARPGM